MGFTKNASEIKSDTYEVVANYTDVVGFFTALGITVANSNQTFTIISRKQVTGGNQDSILGTLDSDQKLVIQFTQVIGPTTLT